MDINTPLLDSQSSLNGKYGSTVSGAGISVEHLSEMIRNEVSTNTRLHTVLLSVTLLHLASHCVV